MKLVTLVAALAAAIPAAFGLTINTPANVVVCEPTQFTWSGGTPPYFLNLVPAAQIAAPALKTFPTQTGTSYTWNVDLGPGTSFTIALKDNTGATAYSDIVTVVGGGSLTCVNTSVTETGGSGGSATGTPSATGGASGSPTSTASSSSSTHSSGAGRLTAFSVNAASVAGLMGLVGAALF